MDTMIARKMWGTLEPFHAMVYFAPEGTDEYTRVGLKRRGSHYLASRSAPMGAVGPEIVYATFFGFAESAVRRYVPACWENTTPEAVIQARFQVADRALRRMLGDEIATTDMSAAAEVAMEAAAACPTEGRPLFAAHTSVTPPEAPHLQLWHAITLLREFRGDGHNAALVARDIGPVVAQAWYSASSKTASRTFYEKSRGHSQEDWIAADAVLAKRGYVDAEGRLTALGSSEREAIEHDTDVASMAPWRAIGEDRCDWLRATVRPWSRSIVAAGGLGIAVG
jgi:ferredoxin